MEDKISIVREIVSGSRKAYSIQKVLHNWSQLCASMDVIEDTQMAIDAYMAEETRSHSKLYLLTYGVLQCLYVQQDAVANLCGALGIKLDFGEHMCLREIRNIRNASVGHPSKKTGKNGPSFHRIIRVSLDVKGFDLLSDNDTEGFGAKTISVYDCIDKQHKQLDEILVNVIEALQREEKEHKMKFKDEKLADSFGCDVIYHCGSMSESISDPTYHPPEMALADIEMISKGMRSFCDVLAKRGLELETYDSLKHEYDDTKFALEKLRCYFENLKVGKASMTSIDARVYWDSLKKHIDDLLEIVESIDQEYQDI